MNSKKEELLGNIVDVKFNDDITYNIRENGKAVARNIANEKIHIDPKQDKPGIDVKVERNVKNEKIYIPVILTKKGMNDLVYNDFYISKNADVTIVAGCGIHNDYDCDMQHKGIHRFFLEEGSNVKYVEKHFACGKNKKGKIINPITEAQLGKNASMTIETTQIGGVDYSDRITNAVLNEDSNLVVIEKIMTTDKQYAQTSFKVELNGENSSTHVTSRSFATDKSSQKFISNIVGNTKCFAHVECDAIIKDSGKVTAIPEITANSVNANLIHEATIGKIAGEQLIKLMTLGLSKKEAEKEIINGFLK